MQVRTVLPERAERAGCGRRRRLRRAGVVLLAVQGGGVAIMVGADGSLARRAGMTAVVVVLTVVANRAAGLNRIAFAGTTLVMGILGTAAGAGIASAEATAGLSAEGALATLVLAAGLALLVLGAVASVRAMPGWWHGWLSHYGILGQLTKAMEWVTYTVADGLSGARRPMPIRQAIEMAARPVLLIAAGNVADEALAARFFQQAAPSSVDVWVVPGAGHTGGLSAHAASWESRVVGFLDAALGPAGGVP
jgi:hypothetical protein